jgi:hypothetical protein
MCTGMQTVKARVWKSKNSQNGLFVRVRDYGKGVPSEMTGR